MIRYTYLLLHGLVLTTALNLEYLDPTKLQTRISADIQRRTAIDIIRKYTTLPIDVEVNPALFKYKKDVFIIKTIAYEGILYIKASSGVAVLWGFHYFLKKYCNSHIGWQVKRIVIPAHLPELDETVVANDRFRYYQNVCTASYSFVWWNVNDWQSHIEWMAMNGINLALAPVAQEAAWARIYKQIGMTQEEIDEHFTGPAFLSWLRMGNVHGWGGPLPQSWHETQTQIQNSVNDIMLKLGMIPVFPAFAGHVPKAFSRIYPNTTFHKVTNWNDFSDEYCCGLFLDPGEPLFKTIGTLFLREITPQYGFSHIFTADPFNEVKLQSSHWSTALVEQTAQSIYSILTRVDDYAVWLLQSWMFVSDPILWPKDRVKTFLTTVPSGRMLILDLQSEQWPQYDLYEMYFEQPFIWCMLHNFGGTLGMFGSMEIINTVPYEVRSRQNSTMVGIGLTPEGINQNYVVYDLMLESAWRTGPVPDLDMWAGDYSERRYGCNGTRGAWKSLVKSVYSYKGWNKVRGKYVVTRKPSFWIKPWAWYSSRDLFDAFRKFVLISDRTSCGDGYFHDLVDVTRQALQYRAEQLYMKLLIDRNSNSWVFSASIDRFLEVMVDMHSILNTNSDYSAMHWLSKAQNLGKNIEEKYYYDLNARNQITLWGPNGEISDYAGKQWAELFKYYYIPRWRTFLSAALDAKLKREVFDERSVQNVIRETVEEAFLYQDISTMITSIYAADEIAFKLFKKWAIVPNLNDLPDGGSLKKKIIDDGTGVIPEVVMWSSTTPLK